MSYLHAEVAPLRPGTEERRELAKLRAALDRAQDAVDEVYGTDGPPEPELTPRAVAAGRTKRAIRRYQRTVHEGRS